MTGGAAFGGVDLTGADKGCTVGTMATDTIFGGQGRVGYYVFPDLRTMVMAVRGKVGGVTVSTSAAFAATDGGIAMSACAINPGTIGT